MALQRIIQRRFVTFSGWPHCIGIGGQLASEWVTTLDRNQWPHCIGIGTVIQENLRHKNITKKQGKKTGEVVYWKSNEVT